MKAARIAVVGAGAAGCFAAIQLGRLLPGADVRVHEAAALPMAKLARTGGGRCNLGNTFADVRSLKEVYPRGDRLMERLFHSFGPEQAADWFRGEGIALRQQEDGRIFPASDDAMQVVRKFRSLMDGLGVKILTHSKINNIAELDADRILVTTGGGALALLDGTGLETIPPVPSLFTFKIQDPSLRAMAGNSVGKARLKLAGTPFTSEGPLLLTDWGVSGPAVLKLSSYAARALKESGYKGQLSVCWTAGSEEEARGFITRTAAAHPKKMVSGIPPEGISSRIWEHLLSRSGIRPDCRWAELGSRGAARLASTMTSDLYEIDGRARFKEEFVTCGGVALKEINPSTMECRKRPGLFLAGEVLDIDAVTGGFNLQAAWSTAWTAAHGIAGSLV